MGRFRRGKERMEERNEYGRACEQLEHPDPIKARRHPTLFPEKTGRLFPRAGLRLGMSLAAPVTPQGQGFLYNWQPATGTPSDGMGCPPFLIETMQLANI